MKIFLGSIIMLALLPFMAALTLGFVIVQLLMGRTKQEIFCGFN